jgi:molecular chaperone DnaK (HSP70)
MIEFNGCIQKQVSDKISRSLGPAVFVDGRYMIENLLFTGDKIPAEASKTYATAIDNQSAIAFCLFENVSREKYVIPSIDERGKEQSTDPALKVKKIGELSLKLPPNTPKGSPIQVVFRASATGLEISATNLATGESISTGIISENTKIEGKLNEVRDRNEWNELSDSNDDKLVPAYDELAKRSRALSNKQAGLTNEPYIPKI